MSEPCELSAVHARKLIDTGDLSPVELVESCLRRIEAVNPAVNAIVATCFERAIDEAKQATAAVARGEEAGRLRGLPLGMKDLAETAGLRTTFGSRIYEHFVPEQDERVVAALRREGAIVVGKTNTPEFGAGANTTNDVYGPTRNPFDLSRTCGGSSGGSAVALATDMVSMCTGSDTGGSLRIPASFCGVVSIRPTPGVVPSDRRTVGLTTYDVDGPMARTVADAALLLSAMAGTDGCDPLAGPLDIGALGRVDDIDLGGVRVAVSEDLGFATVDRRIRETFRKRVEAFESAVRECSWRDPDFAHASRVFWLVRGLHYLAAHAERYRRSGDLLGPNVRANVEAALEMRPDELGWALAEQTRIYRHFQRFFDDVDVLLCPTTAVPPFPVDQLYCTEIDGEPLDNYIKWVDLTAGLTLTGHPVVQIPCGRDPTGTPFGIQVVGPRRHADRFVIAVAAALEGCFATHGELARPRPDIAAVARSSPPRRE